MTLRFLLDTHVVVQWLTAPNKLSSDQIRVLREAARHVEPVAISAYSLVEIAMLSKSPRKIAGAIERIFSELEANPMFPILPITIPIAIDAGAFRGCGKTLLVCSLKRVGSVLIGNPYAHTGPLARRVVVRGLD